MSLTVEELRRRPIEDRDFGEALEERDAARHEARLEAAHRRLGDEWVQHLIKQRNEARRWALLFRDFVGYWPEEYATSYPRYLEAINESNYPDWLKNDDKTLQTP